MPIYSDPKAPTPEGSSGELDVTIHASNSNVNSSIANSPLLTKLNNLRLICGEIVNDHNVQLGIIVLIVINAIMMGVATFDFVSENPKVDNVFEKTDLAFLIIFTIELGMQLIYHGWTFYKDGWLVFDFIIVVLSWSFASLQIIRAFRIFRALRIITRIETMRNLVAALFDIMPRLGAITALLLLIFYIFAVLFTQLFGDLELSAPFFSRLDYSLLTLFVMMTMEWADVARECMDQIWWAWAPFIAFIMITGFIVFNLIIAVVCDAVAVIENKDDLEPDLFSGMFENGSKAEGGEGDGEAGTQGRTQDQLEETVVGSDEALVDDLAQRISFVLDSQREMLATLELLTRDTLVPSSPAEE
mmetsp:Transcript_28228/g.56804  ORF Transcript_28228/g.56804 Transcript_28228/m.56804 type:complete len:359 (+) Transcript_28228:188-1264(+)|eukprot:CAMPEP_0113388296 /NCGR_PEP_ID=MMETSP0013_2-20120614/9006_1 /TAXON_ID=2843 ORGANISM="Skeletonema costatum, Strain 1716" /NCGR_SAMPLE_ID=MMETSP0013_2 /ASSEMBLY_ACC=CAM_ASM_000158 /LENGTH=358 /DNA_ID=CAMNT_0000271273 /DNA_START=154 /DNA_END=1230 /DNA_ORIENTATION=+ /assembly_acc=CAM_ASM_000158